MPLHVEILANEIKHPIAYASRSLNPAEQNYSHLDKETLVIIFGVTKFHQYVYGQEFTLYTVHKPLIHILVSQSRYQLWFRQDYRGGH